MCSFNPVDQYRYLYKRAISSESILMAILLLIFDSNPYLLQRMCLNSEMEESISEI